MSQQNRSRNISVVAIAMGAVVTFAFSMLLGANQTTQPTESFPVRLLNKDVERRLAELERAREALRSEMNDLSDFQPVGIVVAFTGARAPRNWMICNGDTLRRTDFAELAAVLGVAESADTFKLPNLQGVFLRGYDAQHKVDQQPDRVLGSLQHAWTARPTTQPFTTNEAGEHQHKPDPETTPDVRRTTGVFNRVVRRGASPDGTPMHRLAWGSSQGGLIGPGHIGPEQGQWSPDLFHSREIIMDGKHRHTIDDGGDAETRPVNVAVNYIIRVK